MSSESPLIEHVLLVGSIGLDGVEEVFRTVGRSLGPFLQRIPDGEVGGRRLWISWQYPLLRASVFLQPDPKGAVRPTNRFAMLALAERTQPSDVKFGELGYMREARASYLDFCTARESGDIPRDVRFQVCLPTPLAVVSSVVVAADEPAVERAYEQAMIAEVQALCRFIPSSDLCIQWDMCNEMVIWDGQGSDAVPLPETPKHSIIDRMKRLSSVVPKNVELGIHLCYGDFGAKHFVEPRDASAMVDLANQLAATIEHPLSYIHMPVPIAWNTDSYFRPLKGLQLPARTELFLGLVHALDGAEGARARIAMASKHRKRFGIATECGMARARSRDTVLNLLQIHADVCSKS